MAAATGAKLASPYHDQVFANGSRNAGPYRNGSRDQHLRSQSHTLEQPPGNPQLYRSIDVGSSPAEQQLLPGISQNSGGKSRLQGLDARHLDDPTGSTDYLPDGSRPDALLQQHFENKQRIANRNNTSKPYLNSYDPIRHSLGSLDTAYNVNPASVSHAAGGRQRSQHQHHAASALDPSRYHTKEADQYKNPYVQVLPELVPRAAAGPRPQKFHYEMNHGGIEGVEQLKYFDVSI